MQELERANAFVVSLDAQQSGFRYHQLFQDLLALELRRTAPTELPVLHGLAAEWFAQHGHPIDAVRHAQAAENSSLGLGEELRALALVNLGIARSMHNPAPTLGKREPLRERLSASETRVLRYLPTNLTLRDIGNELSVSLHTVKTHTKHIYSKLDAHGRAEAVERARALGLLAPSFHKR